MKQFITDALRWSERYTKTDMLYLAKGGFWAGTGFFVSMLGAFLMSFVFANYFPKEAYGTYKFLFSLAGIAAGFSLSGLSIIVTQAVARGHEGTLRAAVLTSIQWSLIPSAITLCMSVYYGWNGNSTLAYSLLFPTFLSPLITSCGLYGAFLVGKKEFKNSTLYGTVTTWCNNLAIIAAVLLTKDPIVVVGASFATQAIITALFYMYVIRTRTPNHSVERGAITYGKHLSAMGILGTIASNVDNVLVFHYLGAGPLAVYAFASAPINQIQSLYKTTTPIFTPKIAEKTADEVRTLLPEKVVTLTALMIIPTLLYILLIPFFYKTFFPKYIDSIFYSQLLALTMLSYAKKPLGVALVAHGGKKVNYILSIINPAVYLILKIILLPLFGLMGAIAAEIINSAFSVGINFFYVRKLKSLI